MPYSLYLPLSWDQTLRALQRGVWDRWYAAHPSLGDLEDLPALRLQVGARTPAIDEILPALLDLCADLTNRSAAAQAATQSATRAAAQTVPEVVGERPGAQQVAREREILLSLAGHLLGPVLGQVCSRLRGPVQDVDLAVVSALWLALCEGAQGAWEAPRASLGWRVWSLAVEDLGQMSRAEARTADRVELWDHMTMAEREEAVVPVDPVGAPGAEAVAAELAELLDLARADSSVDNEYVDLLLELVSTAVQGDLEATQEHPWHFNHEVSVVANRRGWSARTVRRRRARAVDAVRSAALGWDRADARPAKMPALAATGPGASTPARTTTTSTTATPSTTWSTSTGAATRGARRTPVVPVEQSRPLTPPRAGRGTHPVSPAVASRVKRQMTGGALLEQITPERGTRRPGAVRHSPGICFALVSTCPPPRRSACDSPSQEALVSSNPVGDDNARTSTCRPCPPEGTTTPTHLPDTTPDAMPDAVQIDGWMRTAVASSPPRLIEALEDLVALLKAGIDSRRHLSELPPDVLLAAMRAGPREEIPRPLREPTDPESAQ